MTESFRLRHVHWIVGFFLLVIFVIAVGTALAIILATDTLTPRIPYQVNLDQSQLGGLRKGADVFLLGEKVGKVYDIKFSKDSNGRSQVTITLMIIADFREQIVEDSEVVIIQPLAVANPFIEIRRGSSDVPLLAANEPGPGTLTLEDSALGVADMSQNVTQSMAQIVDNFDRARSAIVWGMNAFRSLSQTSERGLEPALDDLRKAINELRDSTRRTETTLKNTLEDIAETSRTMNDRTKSSSSNLDTNIEEMEQTIADANHNLKLAIEKVNRDLSISLAKFNDVMDDLKKVTQDLPETKDEVDDAVSDADDVIDGLKRHPLLKNHIPQNQGTRQTAPAGVRGGGP